jgi:NAD(P)-dependent dehydrogenase (short-subunit alcohol dehydrogenase family)
MTLFHERALDGSHYLVTGASSGIGRAVAMLLASCGARITAVGRDVAKLEDVISGLPGTGHAYRNGTFTDADQTAAWTKEIADQQGAFTGIFHGAGVECIRPIRLTKQQQITEVMAGALFAAFGIARASAQKGVMTDGGALLFMSSVAGSSGQVGMTAYSAAKAGVDGMVRSLACELAPRAIRVNSLAAGAVETPMHDRIARSSGEAGLEAYRQSHLLGFGAPEDVANAALFLLGPASRWITGTTMVVDGGYLCR